MNYYRVTDINNASYLIEANMMRVETTNNIETYIAFYVDADLIAILNIQNIVAVIKEID